ncbi:hypothetical protein CC78DRAFT_615970 [Lojkania enalia]|uniref:Uncharacterized protein n=1 Tax=Lojkania enalia TaxID=147567 RepID=A0A9P4KFC3_9PLEO|nr:hypothetical protein CC78DRAFT_615970 [Didymosphaeria enalia]
MFLKSLVSTSLVVSTLLIPSAFAKSMKVRWAALADCSYGSLGPTREYFEGKCRTLADSDHGVVIEFASKDCSLVAYTAPNCIGDSVTLEDFLCSSLKGMWSTKVVC